MAAEEQATFQKTMPKIVGVRFENPWPTWGGLPNYRELLRFYRTKKDRNTNQEIEENLPVLKPNFVVPPPSGLIATWLGHSTVLVQIDGVNILTDPILSPRCSPVSFYGPARYRPPPCTFDDLPQIHAVVISHNHHDHLDAAAVEALNKRFGESLRWFVPMNLASWFQKSGVRNVVELTWWQSSKVEVPAASGGYSAEIVFLPCQHWSIRNALNMNTTLWGSWAVLGSKHRFYFAGDTGYCPEFKNIGHFYGPFDLAAIPIGCYLPRDFMKNQHVNPADAVAIHQDVKAKFSLGVHWGTYDMGAIESQLSPKKDLAEEAQRAGLAENKFFTLFHGASWTLPNPEESIN